MTPDGPVRVRFPPSPTGFIHVGNIRSALFNWAFARHHGGTFVLRIEDTDPARNTDEGYDSILDSLRWMGLDWDEGPEVGGPYGPYRQSERFDVYADVAARLRGAGEAYDCFCETAEVDARRKAAGSKTQGYDGFCRELSAEQRAAFEAEGRRAVLRLRMPDEPIAFDDLVRGTVTFQPAHVPDFALLRANGQPLYTLVNPVDDAMMRITHVLRGEDLLSSTPRQIALYRALQRIGVGEGVPAFGHLPIVMGEGNKRLSKRDQGSGLAEYVDAGYLPAGMVNYLALLGWGIAEDRDVFTLAEMVEAFEIERVNPNPARFDLKKLSAINSAHMRRLSVEEVQHRSLPFLRRAGVVGDPMTPGDAQLLEQAMPLVAERITTLGEAPGMLGFLFVDEADFAVDPADAEKLLDEAGRSVVDAAYDALEPLAEWSTAAITDALQTALVDGLGLKPRLAFGPVRVAVTGRRVSPPLFESLELLGRERGLARLAVSRTLS